MNKSSVTNLIAAAVIAAGYIIAARLDPVWGERIRSIGFFALSGALTNWLAIFMLFEKVPGLYGSGVIPAHFIEIKVWIKELVMDQFFTTENLHKYFSEGQDMILESIDFESAVDKVDYDKIYDTVKKEILSSGFGSMLSMFGGDGLFEKYRGKFKEKIREYLLEEVAHPKFIKGILESGNFDLSAVIKDKVDGIVQGRLDELTPKMVKELVKEMMRRHLGWLVVWGGVFGGLIGFVMSYLK